MSDVTTFLTGVAVGFAAGSVIAFKARGRLEKWRTK